MSISRKLLGCEQFLQGIVRTWLRYTAYTGLEEVMQSSLLFNSSFLTVIGEHELSAAMKNEKAMGEVTPKSRLDEGKEERLCHISPPGKC